MATKRITIQLRGSPADDEHLRLSDFIQQLEAIKGALTKLEENLTGSGKASIYYRVVDLRHSSPATVVLDAVPVDNAVRGDVTNLVVDSFVGGIKKIRQGLKPKGFTYELMESVKKIAQPMKKRVTEVSIGSQALTSSI